MSDGFMISTARGDTEISPFPRPPRLPLVATSLGRMRNGMVASAPPIRSLEDAAVALGATRKITLPSQMIGIPGLTTVGVVTVGDAVPVTVWSGLLLVDYCTKTATANIFYATSAASVSAEVRVYNDTTGDYIEGYLSPTRGGMAKLDSGIATLLDLPVGTGVAADQGLLPVSIRITSISGQAARYVKIFSVTWTLNEPAVIEL